MGFHQEYIKGWRPQDEADERLAAELYGEATKPSNAPKPTAKNDSLWNRFVKTLSPNNPEWRGKDAARDGMTAMHKACDAGSSGITVLKHLLTIPSHDAIRELLG